MMSCSKPYCIRAMYDWIVDNDLTPYLVVDANAKGVRVPVEYVEDDSIILNISPKACRGLHLGNDRIVFSAGFGGLAMQIFVPPYAVKAIYAKENGQGMVFSEEDNQQDNGGASAGTASPPSGSLESDKTKPTKPGKPKLKVIK